MSATTAAATVLEISVVIPTFRRPAELREAIASVLAQRPIPLEVIVVDDSPEGSAEGVVREFADAAISYVKHPIPSGGMPSKVRNHGFALTRGRFVHFLDDDDRIPEGHYAAAIAALEANPTVGMVFGRIAPFGERKNDVEREEAYFARAARRAKDSLRWGPVRAFAARQLFGETMLVCSSVVARRDAIAGVGGFNGELRLNEDAEVYSRVARKYGATWMDRVVLHYRIGDSLIHRPGVSDEIARTYAVMHEEYRRTWGGLDFLAMKLFARLVLRWT